MRVNKRPLFSACLFHSSILGCLLSSWYRVWGKTSFEVVGFFPVQLRRGDRSPCSANKLVSFRKTMTDSFRPFIIIQFGMALKVFLFSIRLKRHSLIFLSGIISAISP